MNDFKTYYQMFRAVSQLQQHRILQLLNRLPAMLLAAFFLAACSNDNPSITDPDLYSLGSFSDAGVTVLAWSEEPLSVGYNRIWFEVHQDGDPLDAHIHLVPMMHMEAHSHSSPVEEPGIKRDAVYGLYEGAVVFTMPSGTMGSWELQLTVHDRNHSGLEAVGVIDVEVDESARVRSFQGDDGNRYVLTLVEPASPVVGSNELVITLHQRVSMMSFPAVKDGVIGFEPWMPSMDHGSQNNEHPVHQQNGHYKGVVTFNMTGDWELRFDPVVGGVDLGRQVIEITF